jgi:hypothetical protein
MFNPQPPAAPTGRYSWSPRRDRLNWDIAEAIAIDQIWESGDLRSVLFYTTKHFVNATVTKEDLPKFGTPGALHAFLLLQLGVDFLLSETQRLEAESGGDSAEAEMVYTKQIQQFNESIFAARREIEKRDQQIAELEKKRRAVHRESQREKAELEACLKRIRAAKKERGDEDETDEPGAIRTIGRMRRGRQSDESERDSGWSEDEDYAGPTKLVGRVADEDSGEF